MKNEINHFLNCEDLKAAKAKYKKLALVLHPDKPTGDEGRFKMMKAEFDRICKENIWPVPRKGSHYTHRPDFTNWTSDQFRKDDAFWDAIFRKQQAARDAAADQQQRQYYQHRQNPYTSGNAKYHGAARGSGFDPKAYYQWFDNISVTVKHGKHEHTLIWNSYKFTEAEANKIISVAFNKHGKLMHKENLIDEIMKFLEAKQSAREKRYATGGTVKPKKEETTDELFERKRREAELYNQGMPEQARKVQEEKDKIIKDHIHQMPLTPDECFKVDPDGDINDQLNKINNATPKQDWKDISLQEKLRRGFSLGSLFDDFFK